MPDQALVGVVVVDKPAGITSHDVVARARRLAGTRKVGHAGTLDPMATGVLLLGIGRATRLLGHLMLTDKSYDATIRLGASTSTDDAEGETLRVADPAHPAAELSASDVTARVASFVGDIDQIPSAVSAIKVDGIRAYARVRAGDTPELAARQVHVRSFDVHAVRVVGEFLDVEVSVECSTGTYIRALARDLGAALGVGGHLTSLRRTRVGPFGLDQARTLDQLAQHFELLGMVAVARATFAGLDLSDTQAADVRVGRTLNDLALPATGAVAVFDPAGDFLALYAQHGADARPVAVFV